MHDKRDPKLVKRTIVDAIKDLDRTDYIDLCVLIKSNTTETTAINENARGTFIDLDGLDDGLLLQLENMILTKLQRIAER
jgi:hypothetical protein